MLPNSLYLLQQYTCFMDDLVNVSFVIFRRNFTDYSYLSLNVSTNFLFFPSDASVCF